MEIDKGQLKFSKMFLLKFVCFRGIENTKVISKNLKKEKIEIYLMFNFFFNLTIVKLM